MTATVKLGVKKWKKNNSHQSVCFLWEIKAVTCPLSLLTQTFKAHWLFGVPKWQEDETSWQNNCLLNPSLFGLLQILIVHWFAPDSCHLKAILEWIWPHFTMRIWRSPTSEGSRRQLFWQLASSSCHFGTPNNQRALYVWVSSDKEHVTSLISHKKQTYWKKTWKWKSCNPFLIF